MTANSLLRQSSPGYGGRMKSIDQDVPDGQTLIAGPLSWRGPCHAAAGVAADAEVRLVDTPGDPERRSPAEIARRQALRDLRALDVHLPRISEDILDALLATSTLTEGNLPKIVCDRLTAKKAARAIVAGA